MVAGLTLAVVLLALLGEWLHAGRCRRAAALAFGERGRPRAWVTLAPLLRVAAVGAIAWGMLVLYELDLQGWGADERPPEELPSQHILLCLDVSPSMYLADAGPRGDQRRNQRARDLLLDAFDRIDMERTRVTIYGIYTDARQIVRDTWDFNVVLNIIDGLPLNWAFEPGETDLSGGIAKALEAARGWPTDSGMLLVISDGDEIPTTSNLRLPPSIADVLILGVGDKLSGSEILNRRSRQNVAGMTSLANRLQGTYHDGNVATVPPKLLRNLQMAPPPEDVDTARRDNALIALLLGSATLALLPLALALAGSPLPGPPLAVPAGGRR